MYLMNLVILGLVMATGWSSGADTLRKMIAGRVVRCCDEERVCNSVRFNASATRATWIPKDPNEGPWAVTWSRGDNASVAVQPSFPTEPMTFLTLGKSGIRWDSQVCTLL